MYILLFLLVVIRFFFEGIHKNKTNTYAKKQKQKKDCLRNRTQPEIVTAQLAAENDIIADAGHFFDLFLPWTPTMGDHFLTVFNSFYQVLRKV